MTTEQQPENLLDTLVYNVERRKEPQQENEHFASTLIVSTDMQHTIIVRTFRYQTLHLNQMPT